MNKYDEVMILKIYILDFVKHRTMLESRHCLIYISYEKYLFNNNNKSKDYLKTES